MEMIKTYQASIGYLFLIIAYKLKNRFNFDEDYISKAILFLIIFVSIYYLIKTLFS